MALRGTDFECRIFGTTPLFRGAWSLDVATMLAGALDWGLLLMFGVYYVPARSGLPVRELVVRVLGPWAGGLVWWILLPVWLVNWCAYQMHWFVVGVQFKFLRESEWWGRRVDNTLAIYWPWLVLTALPGLVNGSGASSGSSSVRGSTFVSERMARGCRITPPNGLLRRHLGVAAAGSPGGSSPFLGRRNSGVHRTNDVVMDHDISPCQRHIRALASALARNDPGMLTERDPPARRGRG